MTNWQPASPALWQGRDDRAESPTALRLFQTITLSPAFSPEMYSEQIALLGFACCSEFSDRARGNGLLD